MSSTRAGPAWRRAPSWVRAAAALGVVAVASALGAGLGVGLRAVLSGIDPALDLPVDVVIAVLAFALGWRWYATADRHWAADEGEEGSRQP